VTGLSRADDLREALLRVENLLERLRMEYHRDMAERLFYLEHEVLSLRRELRRLSDILESLYSALTAPLGPLEAHRLRDLTSREVFSEPVRSSTSPTSAIFEERAKPRRKRALRSERKEAFGKVELTKDGVLRYLTTEANDTELRILRLLYENPDYGNRGSTEIARMIGKVREHTARTLKKLCEKGLLIREEGGIPYAYALPREVAEAVKAYLEGRA